MSAEPRQQEHTRHRVLVIGLGSIGRRHLSLLEGLGCDTAVCTGQDTETGVVAYETLQEALQAHQPDHVVISNPTFQHRETLHGLHDLRCAAEILVEKPLFRAAQDDLPVSFQAQVGVAYCLRFHPVVLGLRQALRDEEPVAAQFYTGQHLSTWRPERDYRHTYSATVHGGGGVLRDLSHELDLGLWLFGPWRRLVAHGGHFSELEIETEDTVGIWWEAPRCPKVGVEINYLDRAPRRSILVHTRRHTWEADLLGGRLLCDGAVVRHWTLERNAMYLAQDRAWLNHERDILCSYQEGLAVLRMIEAIECSITRQCWIRPETAS